MSKLLLESEVAALTQLSRKTLQAWRVSGHGPKFHKLGAAVRYDAAELAAWLAAAACSSTSSARSGKILSPGPQPADSANPDANNPGESLSETSSPSPTVKRKASPDLVTNLEARRRVRHAHQGAAIKAK